MITLLIYFIVLVILFSVAWYVLNTFVTEPTVKKILSVVLIVIAALIVVYLLMGMIGGRTPALPRVNSLWIVSPLLRG